MYCRPIDLARATQASTQMVRKYEEWGFLPPPSSVEKKPLHRLARERSMSMTLDVYSHVIPTMQAEAVNRLQALLVAQG